MSTFSHAAHAFAARSPLLSAIRRVVRGFDKRIPRRDLDSFSDELKRDLGFADGHAAPPRDLFRD